MSRLVCNKVRDMRFCLSNEACLRPRLSCSNILIASVHSTNYDTSSARACVRASIHSHADCTQAYLQHC